jgi:hypothetical protein
MGRHTLVELEVALKTFLEVVNCPYCGSPRGHVVECPIALGISKLEQEIKEHE